MYIFLVKSVVMLVFLVKVLEKAVEGLFDSRENPRGKAQSLCVFRMRKAPSDNPRQCTSCKGGVGHSGGGRGAGRSTTSCPYSLASPLPVFFHFPV